MAVDQRLLAAVRHPHLGRAHLVEGGVQLVPVGVVGNHQRQLDAALPRPLAHPHPARGQAHHRLGQPPRPAVGDRRGRRQHDAARPAPPSPPPWPAAGRPARTPSASYTPHSGASAPCRKIGAVPAGLPAAARSAAGTCPARSSRRHGCAPGNSATLASSRPISAAAGGWRNTGRAKVASVTNTSQGTGTNGVAGRVGARACSRR